MEKAKKDITPMEQFVAYMETYERNNLPDLLATFNIKPSHFKQLVISELKRDEKLLSAFMANPVSLFASILAGAEIGLIPSELLGEFFLIPRNITANGKQVLTVTPQIGYKGIVKILLRSGDTTRIHTEVVYEDDYFEELSGLEPDIIHRKTATERTADKITKVYAVAKNKYGEYTFTVLTRDDVININKMSKYDNKLYFNNEKDPMHWMEKKTAIMQLSKLLPKDYYATRAIELDNRIAGGAILTLDEGEHVKIIDGDNNVIKKTYTNKNRRNLYSGFGDDENQP